MRTTTFAALCTLATASTAFAVDPVGYHTFEETESLLRAFARDSDIAELETIGQSAGGRAIHIIRLAGDGPVDPDERPALFVGANMAGFHNAGTEAAIAFLEAVDDRAGEEAIASLLRNRTIYVAPILNPDAHDAIFESPRRKRAGNAMQIDHDRDGETGEDPPNDLNGDGVITMMRILEPGGAHAADEVEPRLLVRPDALEGQRGAYRLLTEGDDDDGDGKYNEDDGRGVAPDMNFAHAFPFPKTEAGPWASYAPESKAIMDFILARRNIAAAVVFGPANNLLTPPRSLGGQGFDPGSQKLDIPQNIANFLGLDPEQQYTIDEVWEVAKDLPFVQQNNVTKDQLIQIIGAGPATKPDDEDLKYIDHFAKSYKERLKEAGLDDKRPGENYGAGGFTPWLYYQCAVFAFEVDVWGPPKREKKSAGEEEGLTIEQLEEMSSEDFLALGEEKIAAFLEKVGAPAQFSASMVMQRVEGGQVSPPQMAQMLKRMPQAETKKEGESRADERELDLLAWVDSNSPGGFIAWTPVTLANGTQAEVGWFDPFAAIAPPRDTLDSAIPPHTETILDLAGKLPDVELIDVKTESLGAGVMRITATARNAGFLPTHTRLAVRAQTHLPVRLEIELPEGAELITGRLWETQNRLANEVFKAEWVVRASGGSARVFVTSENAGSDERTIELGGNR